MDDEALLDARLAKFMEAVTTAVREYEAGLPRSADEPFPGAARCPSCWDTSPRETATFNNVTHHSAGCGRYCLTKGIGSRNIAAKADALADEVRSWLAQEAEPLTEETT